MSTNHSPELAHFALWASQELETQAKVAKGKGIPSSSMDPEVNAKIPPPAMSESGYNVISWKTNEIEGEVQQRKNKPAKRDLETIDVDKMEMQVPPEVQERVASLETQAALLRREHNLPTGGTPSK